MNISKLAVSILISPLLSVSVVEATPPPDMIMVPIKKTIAILRNPDYRKSGHKDLLWQKIRNVIRNDIDFTPFSRQTLGKYWKTFTTQQKREFKAAFFEFLACVYIPKLIIGYKGQKVYYDDMEVKLNKVAWIRIKFEDLPNPIFLTFNIVNHDGFWKIYDVRIAGASLAEKYRKPFAAALTKESPQRLICWLKKRVKEQQRSGRCPVP
ncbi:MAG: ABC transporter substrate-binding protein [Desulfobacterales bacterium]|jgi:phospholipid transport system substrate-binding protein